MARIRLDLLRVSRLSAAIAISAIVHLIAVFGHKFEFLIPQTDLPRLEAKLVRTPPAKEPGQAPEPKEPPKPKIPVPTPEEAPKPPEAAPKETPAEVPPPPPPQPEPKVEEKQPPQPEVPPPPPEPPKAVGNAWPREGQIKYFLFGGENRNTEGASTAELRWKIASDGRYTMRLSSSDAKPFPSMPWFKISLLWASEGRFVDGRFQPERYEEEVSVFQHVVVNFDWTNKTVNFAGHQLPLAPGTLDYLSVIMQAGDPGFIEAGTLAVATGRGLRQYKFHSLGAADLALPFGMTWKTTQLVGQGGSNDVRVWLATEKFNLPVQIRFVVNKVNYYLVATDVRASVDSTVNMGSNIVGSTTAPAPTPSPAPVPAQPATQQEKQHAVDPAPR